MSTAKHTPGPWYYKALSEDCWFVFNRKDTITACGNESDARLIAAAPEMLEVLQELDECASYWSQYDVPIGIHDRIKAAIAKAKGEQP